MTTPNKPSKEELEAKIKEAADIPEEELNKPSEEESPEEKPEEESEPKKEEEEVKEEAEEESPEEKPEDQAEPSKELYKKKFSASSRENQKIHAKNRVINQAIIEADDIPAPTEEEMKNIYGEDWDLASEIEKESLLETQISRKWRAKIKEASDQATKIEKWNESVDTFIDDPKTLNDNPELEGKTEEFREFALGEANNSVPFNILVSAFLHEHSKNSKTNKGRMFERGSGGPNEKPQPKSDKITLEEGRKLRETDYNKWKEYLRARKIENNL